MIKGTWVQYTWIILSILTIFMGSMMAYKEKVPEETSGLLNSQSGILYSVWLVGDAADRFCGCVDACDFPFAGQKYAFCIRRCDYL